MRNEAVISAITCIISLLMINNASCIVCHCDIEVGMGLAMQRSVSIGDWYCFDLNSPLKFNPINAILRLHFVDVVL